MKVIQANQVLQFLSVNPAISILQFYNLITQGGKNFNYYISARGNGNWNALQLACKGGNKDLVNALLKMGANPNFSRNGGLTPLYDAIDIGNLDIVKMLIEHGAKCDKYGDSVLCTYLDFARKKGNPEIITCISEHIKNTDKVTECTDLSASQRYEIIKEFKQAIKESDLQKAQILLKQHEINLPEIFFNFSDGCTRVATAAGNFELVQLLAAYGDELIEANHIDKISIPMLARNAGFIEIAQFLEKAQKESYRILQTEGFKQLNTPCVKRNNLAFFDAMNDSLADDLKMLFHDTDAISQNLCVN